MKLHTINTGLFKLDGGAMFGVVPKTIWQKLNPADGNNMCTWAMRCLLIEHQNKLILIDNGIGTKQDAKFLSHYYLHGDDSLQKSIEKLGFAMSDITDMFLTHLHFDHCGGGVVRKDDKLIPTFSNATYWTNESHWQWAMQPNAREKASFLKENLLPMQESGQLKLTKEDGTFIYDFVEILFMDGHTEKQMLPKIKFNDKIVVFCADLLPAMAHLPLPYVISYDLRPLQTLTEKELFLNQAADENWILFFEHDPIHECCTVQRTDKGVRIKDIFKLSEIM
jgi:glyoxylase-like metal-dependent hydrolase (beta-lactamase superfamily II)